MLFSAKAEYACLAMLELAARHGDPKPIRLADIAERHGIPQRFLVQILLQLKGGGLVASTRGAAGGYHLARSPDEITLLDILTVVDPEDPNPPRRSDATGLASAVRGVWDDLAKHRQTVLAHTTLAALAEQSQGLQYVI
jgi:Rrf2 family transcriptional regulator, cysteine metabolism repressor